MEPGAALRGVIRLVQHDPERVQGEAVLQAVVQPPDDDRVPHAVPGIGVGRLGEAGDLERQGGRGGRGGRRGRRGWGGGCRALRREQAWQHQQTRKHDGAHQIASGWGSKAGSAGTVTGCSSMTTTVAASGVLV